ncbi:RNA-directed DNA polymerase, eukaryota, reverse transcriptase zinc-binding domain protein [Tanacetum coccineum]
MSSNRRGLKRNVRIPRRYENSSVVTCKKAAKVNNGSNNGVVMEAQGNAVTNEVLSLGINEVVARNETISDVEKTCNSPKNKEPDIVTERDKNNVMWGRFSLKDMIVIASGINLFEFKDKEGKPMMMDDMTTKMCQSGVGRTDYARVLVEFKAKKVVKNEIKIEYIDIEKVKGTKEVKVMYDWKPEACSHCNVFRHCVEKCKSRPRTEEEIKSKFEAKEKVRKDNEEKAKKEFKANDTIPKQGQKSGVNVNPKAAKVIEISSSDKFDVLNSVVEDDVAEIRVLKDKMYLKDQWELDRLKEREEQGMNVHFTQSYEKKIKPFRFANYIVDKEEFLPTVASEWRKEVHGCRIYNLSSKILSVCDEDGNRYEGKLMEDQFVNHFKKFLGARSNSNTNYDSNGVFGKKLSNLEAEDMVRDVSDNEVKLAMFDIGDNRAPGPDGYTSYFYKKAWSIMELLKGYDKKSGPRRCCLKIDIAKAYDTTDWNFLEQTLIQFSFHKKTIKWIMVCASTAKFFMRVNCEIKRYFTSGRGLRNVKDEVVAVILIPKTIVKDIDKFLKGFMWRKRELKRVSDMIVNNKWRWPEEWMKRYPILIGLEVPKLEEYKEKRKGGDFEFFKELGPL